MGETGEEGGGIVCVEGFNKGVPFKFNGFKEDEPQFPGRSPLIVRFFCDGGFSEIFASHA